mmetsp:Transcript_15431/g.36428  ORF Transcript_15431/g.36428 Transcript_15431/m.36428 type:complete len:208 (+) Transcript_15431:1932-2555(+)
MWLQQGPMACLDEFPHYLETYWLGMLVSLTKAQKQRHDFVHSSLNILSRRNLHIAQPQCQVSHHAHEGLDNSLDALFHVIHQLDRDCPQVLKDARNLAPLPATEEHLRCLNCCLSSCSSGMSKGKHKILGQQRPLLGVLGGQSLRRLAAEIVCHKRHNSLPEGSIRIEQIGIKLWAQRDWTYFFLQLFWETSSLQIDSLAHNLARPN